MKSNKTQHEVSYYRYIRALISFRMVSIVLTLLALILPIVLMPSTMPSWSIVLTIFALIFLGMTSVFDRNYYLRFLNRSVFPTGILVENKNKEKEKENESKKRMQYTVRLPKYKNTKIVYWASRTGDFGHPSDAYGDYTNAGVVTTDHEGKATMTLDEAPGTYIVPYKGRLMPHIHYRVMEIDGMLGEVETYRLP